VAWEDLTGGGDRDFDDVVLKFEIERIPVYKGVGSAVIPETATAHNTYAFQVGNAVIEAWYEYDPATDKPAKLWFKTSALADLPEGYKFKLTGPNGEDLPDVGSNPFTLKALKAGESDIQYFAPVTGPVKLTVVSPAVATIEKRAVVGYDTINVNFGDTHETYQIPQLDVTEKVNLTWGKYEVDLPDVVNNLTGEQKFEATKVVVTVPASVSVENLTPEFTPSVEDFNIQKPEMPVQPNRADYSSDEEYKAAVEKYVSELKEYYNAVATYQGAQAAAKMIKEGQEVSLKVEKAAIDAVNKILKGYLVDAISHLKTDFQKGMNDLNNQKEQYENLVTSLQQQLEEAKAAGDTNKVQILQAQIDAYSKAVEKIADATANLGNKAIEFSKQMVEGFKNTMKSLIDTFTSKAAEFKSKAESAMAAAEQLADAKNVDYYVNYGKAILYDEVASGFEQGAKIATAVLESYISVDATVNVDAAEALDSVDVADVNISI
jgi:molecular chaperone GrpE (heat shock protein)